MPGLIGAVVWTRSPRLTPLPSDWERPTALTIPSVSVPLRPKGLPIASTMSPALTVVESANLAGLRSVAPETFNTARSFDG